MQERRPLLETPLSLLPRPSTLSHAQAQTIAERAIARRADGSLYPLDTPVLQLGKLGVGVGLYFNFIFFAGWVMGLQTLLNLPTMVSNAAGKAAFDPTEQLSFPRNIIAAMSLGNHTAGDPVTVHALVDFVSSLAFIIFVCVFRRVQVRKAQDIELANITAADYSIHVEGLPPTATDASEISRHFARYGEIAVVSISFDNGNEAELLAKRQRLTDVMAALAGEQSDVTRASTVWKEKATVLRELEEVNTKLDAIAAQELSCTGHAFVTFMLESSARVCIEEHADQRGWFRSTPTKHLFRGQFSLHVIRAPQPSDVIWEHLRYSAFSRTWRQLLTTFVSLVLVVFATALIAAVNGKHLIFPISHIEVFETIGLNIVTVIVILGANVSLFMTIPKLAAFEKYHYKSNAEVLVMLRLLSFQVLNTISASLIMWNSSETEQGKTNWLHWYADGGYFLLNIMIGDALLMNAIEFFRPFDVMLNRKYLAKKAKTQRELDALYEQPSYSLGMRYQFALKAVVVALCFGAGMPLLYLLGALLFFFTYWVDKYNLLRVYKKPPTYGGSVATIVAVVVLPLAMVLHLCVGLVLYTAVVDCPDRVVCAPSAMMTLPFLLLCGDLAIQLGVWHPLLLKHPNITADMVRAREVPYNCVGNIERYDPPSSQDQPERDTHRRRDYGTGDEDVTLQRMESDDEIGVSVF